MYKRKHNPKLRCKALKDLTYHFTSSDDDSISDNDSNREIVPTIKHKKVFLSPGRDKIKLRPSIITKNATDFVSSTPMHSAKKIFNKSVPISPIEHEQEESPQKIRRSTSLQMESFRNNTHDYQLRSNQIDDKCKNIFPGNNSAVSRKTDTNDENNLLASILSIDPIQTENLGNNQSTISKTSDAKIRKNISTKTQRRGTASTYMQGNISCFGVTKEFKSVLTQTAVDKGTQITDSLEKCGYGTLYSKKKSSLRNKQKKSNAKNNYSNERQSENSSSTDESTICNPSKSEYMDKRSTAVNTSSTDLDRVGTKSFQELISQLTREMVPQHNQVRENENENESGDWVSDLVSQHLTDSMSSLSSYPSSVVGSNSIVVEKPNGVLNRLDVENAKTNVSESSDSEESDGTISDTRPNFTIISNDNRTTQKTPICSGSKCQRVENIEDDKKSEPDLKKPSVVILRNDLLSEYPEDEDFRSGISKGKKKKKRAASRGSAISNKSDKTIGDTRSNFNTEKNNSKILNLSSTTSICSHCRCCQSVQNIEDDVFQTESDTSTTSTKKSEANLEKTSTVVVLRNDLLSEISEDDDFRSGIFKRIRKGKPLRSRSISEISAILGSTKSEKSAKLKMAKHNELSKIIDDKPYNSVNDALLNSILNCSNCDIGNCSRISKRNKSKSVIQESPNHSKRTKENNIGANFNEEPLDSNKSFMVTGSVLKKRTSSRKSEKSVNQEMGDHNEFVDINDDKLNNSIKKALLDSILNCSQSSHWNIGSCSGVSQPNKSKSVIQESPNHTIRTKENDISVTGSLLKTRTNNISRKDDVNKKNAKPLSKSRTKKNGKIVQDSVVDEINTHRKNSKHNESEKNVDVDVSISRKNMSKSSTRHSISRNENRNENNISGANFSEKQLDKSNVQLTRSRAKNRVNSISSEDDVANKENIGRRKRTKKKIIPEIIVEESSDLTQGGLRRSTRQRKPTTRHYQPAIVLTTNRNLIKKYNQSTLFNLDPSTIRELSKLQISTSISDSRLFTNGKRSGTISRLQESKVKKKTRTKRISKKNHISIDQKDKSVNNEKEVFDAVENALTEDVREDFNEMQNSRETISQHSQTSDVEGSNERKNSELEIQLNRDYILRDYFYFPQNNQTSKIEWCSLIPRFGRMAKSDGIRMAIGPKSSFAGFQTGYIEILPGRSKARDMTKKYSLIFIVNDGKALFEVHDSYNYTEPSDMVYVPIGAYYSIKNQSNTESLFLNYVQIKSQLQQK